MKKKLQFLTILTMAIAISCGSSEKKSEGESGVSNSPETEAQSIEDIEAQAAKSMEEMQKKADELNNSIPAEAGSEPGDNSQTETETASTEVSADDIKYPKYTYPKKFTEETLEKGPSDMLDFRDRDGDKFIGIKFADGKSGTLVLRNGRYFNYTIREKTEVRFATKEDGLQRIWDDSKSLQDAGAAIGGMMSGKSGPRKKDGSLDMRYKENK